MYNGSNGNGFNNYASAIGNRMRGRKWILYLAMGGAILLAAWVVFQFFNVSLVMHYSVAAGIVLLLINARDLLANQTINQRGSALANLMVGGGLVFAWVSQFFGPLFWIPALILLVAALPLAIGRTQTYRTYLNTARGVYEQARRTVNINVR